MSNLAHSQNKGLSKYQRTASQLQTHPSLHGGREEGLQQPEPEGKGLLQSQPQRWHLPPLNRLPAANHVFLRSWMVDSYHAGHSLRSALQRRHMAHLRWCFHSTLRKMSGWNQGVGCMAHQGQCTHRASGLLSSSELGMAQNTHPTHTD